MNENLHPRAGKISLHGDGMGAPSPDLVEKRAREIALINEREPDDFTDADWDQARRELIGDVLPNLPEGAEGSAGIEGEWPPVAGDTGHRVPRIGVDDDDGETLGEHLVEDGVEEATHDQMLEARKEELEQEGGIT